MPDQPLADLPDEITLTRDEAAVILFGLDVVDQADVTPAEEAKMTRAVHVLTNKLWPDLGDLLHAMMGRGLGPMTTRLMDGGVRSPEGGERLGIDAADAYWMLIAGELDGGSLNRAGHGHSASAGELSRLDRCAASPLRSTGTLGHRREVRG